jgi:hypothetical protein
MRPVTLTRAALPVMTSALGAADVSRPKKKNGRDQGKKKKILLFSFLCLLFYLQYSKKKKKIQISNFKIRKFKKKKVGFTF